MEPEILATLIAVGAGATGYSVREFRNRARPFITVEKIDGKVQRNVENVPVPEDARKLLRERTTSRNWIL